MASDEEGCLGCGIVLILLPLFVTVLLFAWWLPFKVYHLLFA